MISMSNEIEGAPRGCYMKTTYTSSEIVSGALPLSARVQKALKLIEEGRFQKKPLFTEGLTVLDEETVKLPLVKRKALAIKKVLSEMPIEIREHELLVGCSVHGRSKIIFSTPFPEYATQDEKDAATEKFTGTGSVFGHFSPYYPRYLKLGLNGLRGMALEKLDMTRKNGKAPEKEVWYESVIICLDALAELIRRYRDLASKLADGETDAARKEKLQVIAGISQHLLQGPPQSFREALQALWFAHIAFMSTLNKLPVGRFDQNLWPYLKRDLENGVITIVEAQELIDCLWLKFNERLQAFEIIGTGLWYTDDSAPAAARAAGAGAFGIFLGGKTSQDRIVSDGGSTGQF